MRPFFTPHEKSAERILSDVGDRHGLRVYAHVKLSHVVSEQPPGVTWDQWKYATRAELDFVVLDAKSGEVEFAIELDDSSHASDKAAAHDSMKNAVCEAAGLELLRVEFGGRGDDVRRGVLDHRVSPGRRLVEYLIEARSFRRAVDEAHERGEISPFDDPDYRDVFVSFDDPDLLDGNPQIMSNDFARPARLKALDLRNRGLIASGAILVVHFHWRSGAAEGWAWLQVADDLLLFVRSQLRSYRFACGIAPGDLAQDLSTAAIGDLLDRYMSGDAVAVRISQFKEQIEFVRERIDEIEDPDHLDQLPY